MSTIANIVRRSSDRRLFLAAAVAFPLLVLIAYFKSYYFRSFFDAPPLANALVHAHGLVMTLWVAYFSLQIALVRTRNVRLHRTLGFAGVALAALVIVVGMAAAYDSHMVRRTAPPGIDPHGFFLIPIFDMTLFALFFGGAIYYRRRAAEHKSLMLMTAINFLPAAFVRLPLAPEKLFILWAYGMPDLLALGALAWQTVEHRRLNKVFAAAVLLLIGSQVLRVKLAGSPVWLDLAARLAP